MEHQTDIQLKQIKDQMALLAEQAKKLKERIDVSHMIYNAEMRFEPLISHTYHLYEAEDGSFKLLMVGPNEWGKKGSPHIFISTVKLLADHTWEIIK